MAKILKKKTQLSDLLSQFVILLKFGFLWWKLKIFIANFFHVSPNTFWRIFSMFLSSLPTIKGRWKIFCCNYFDVKPQFDWTKGLNTVCKAYHTFYEENTPIPTQSLRRILKLILQENCKNYLQTHGTAMGTKMAVAFANIFMSAVETEILNLSKTKPKRYIDDIFSLWRTERKEIYGWNTW